jgi:predicted alpha/beta-fold hydrolase
MSSQSKLQALLTTALQKISSPLYKIVPGLANRKIQDSLLIPQKYTNHVYRIPKGIKQFEFKTSDGSIQGFLIGKGPVVVMVHGWGGGAYQFFPLMRGLAQIGFSALAFDHLGHGLSDAKAATLQQSIATTNEVLTFVREKMPSGLTALVGHSSGCITIANAQNHLIKDMPLFMISPVFNFRVYFLKRLNSLNFPSALIKQYATQITKMYKQLYARLELARHLDQYADVTVIAHDQNDNLSPVSDSIKFCKTYPMTRILITKEYDHSRIINSESVWQELKSHLNYEDTTINFIDQFKPR